MKYKLKRYLFTIIIIIIGISTSLFLYFYKDDEKSKMFKSEYIQIKISNMYPFPLLFKKGISIKEIKNKYGIGAQNIYKGKEELSDDVKVYENTTLSFSKK